MKLNEKTLVALMIQQKIEKFDDNLKANSQVDSDLTQDLKRRSIIGSEHVSLGSPSTLVSIAEIEQQHVDNASFTDFRKKIGKAFSNYFNKNIKFNALDQVWENDFNFR